MVGTGTAPGRLTPVPTCPWRQGRLPLRGSRREKSSPPAGVFGSPSWTQRLGRGLYAGRAEVTPPSEAVGVARPALRSTRIPRTRRFPGSKTRNDVQCSFSGVMSASPHGEHRVYPEPLSVRWACDRHSPGIAGYCHFIIIIVSNMEVSGLLT